jgi:hypothetical protein
MTTALIDFAVHGANRAARAAMARQLPTCKSDVFHLGFCRRKESQVDSIDKRTAVLERSFLTRRLNLVEVLGAAVELGLSFEGWVALVERCARVTEDGERAKQISEMFVREYRARRLHLDELIGLAAELGFEEEELLRLIDDCGDTDLAA